MLQRRLCESYPPLMSRKHAATWQTCVAPDVTQLVHTVTGPDRVCMVTRHLRVDTCPCQGSLMVEESWRVAAMHDSCKTARDRGQRPSLRCICCHFTHRCASIVSHDSPWQKGIRGYFHFPKQQTALETSTGWQLVQRIGYRTDDLTYLSMHVSI